jgi:hypothetical protein
MTQHLSDPHSTPPPQVFVFFEVSCPIAHKKSLYNNLCYYHSSVHDLKRNFM